MHPFSRAQEIIEVEYKIGIMEKIWAILPVKLLEQTKSRLTAVLTPSERAELTQFPVKRTLNVLQNVTRIQATVVISRDAKIAQLAKNGNAYCVPEPAGGGLNKAVQTGYHFVNKQNAQFALIVPSDLAFLTSADVMAVIQQASQNKAVIAPDQVEDGTNALLLPSKIDFLFQYGRSSFTKHLNEAKRHQLIPQIVHRANLQFDLDTVQDFTMYQNKQSANSPQLLAVRTSIFDTCPPKQDNPQNIR